MFNLFRDRTAEKTFFDLMGETTIHSLVERFYQVMENDPLAAHCLSLHQLTEGKVDELSKQKLKDFLIGWLGGPQIFVEKYGPPAMRRRHAHIKINQQAKDQWLYCMQRAVKEVPNLTRKEKRKLILSFTALAIRIQNI